MASHFLLHHKRDGYRAYRCRSLNKQIMCQINFEVYGNSSNKYFNHESSNFMLSGNRRRGRQKPKDKIKNTPKIPAAASYVCWLPRESTTARNPFPHHIPGRPCRLRLGFKTSYDMLTNEARVTMTVVPDFFFTLRSIEDGHKCDHYRRYTASNSEPIFHKPPAAATQ